MPPKIRYTPERVLDAAYALVRASGPAALSARNVAAALGCSTAPVFTQFRSMDELHEAVIDRALAAFAAHVARGVHTDPLVAAGLGMVQFAADEPSLYAALFLTKHPWAHKFGPLRRDLARRLADHPRYAALPDAARFGLVGRASVVVHGLGVEIWSGRLPDASAPTLTRYLEQLAGPMVDAALAHGWTQDIHALPRSEVRP